MDFLIIYLPLRNRPEKVVITILPYYLFPSKFPLDFITILLE